jgi:PAS domain S-box-containing protein
MQHDRLRQLELIEVAFNEAGDGLALIDIERLAYLEVNEAMCRIFGVSRPQMLAAGPVAMRAAALDATEDDKAAQLRDAYAGLVANFPHAVQAEQSIRRPDGSIVEIEAVRRAVKLQGSWVAVVSMRDITRRKAAQRRADMLFAAIDQAPDSIVVVDAQTLQYVDFNDATCRATGLTREEVFALGAGGISERAGARSREELRALYARIVAMYPEPMIQRGTFGPPGMPVAINEYIRRAVQVDGRWLIISIGRNILERVKAQRHLERLLAAINEAGDGILVVDPVNMMFVDVNEAAAALYGRKREAMLSCKIYEVTHGFGFTTPQELRSLYDRVIALHPDADVQVGEFTRPNAPPLLVESTRRAVKVDGEWLIVNVIRDVTDRERASAQLQQHAQDLARSNRELEQFAYVASHDLSEPLRMVGSYAQLLGRRYANQFDEDGREFLGYVVGGAQRMKQTIDDLLAYSRAGRGGKPAQVLALDEPLDEALANLAHALTESGAVVERPARLPSLNCDRVAMTQLFQNLIGNAIKFRSAAPCVIRIEAQQGAREWTLSVRDNGIGIPSQYAARVFEIFQRLHSRSEYEGTGIGLAICKKIAESHGGRIWVESEAGQGAAFMFTLPAGT